LYWQKSEAFWMAQSSGQTESGNILLTAASGHYQFVLIRQHGDCAVCRSQRSIIQQAADVVDRKHRALLSSPSASSVRQHEPLNAQKHYGLHDL